MSSDIFRKGMVLGIIVLFIGASFIPGISGNVDETIMDDISTSTTELNYETSENEPVSSLAFGDELDRQGSPTINGENINSQENLVSDLDNSNDKKPTSGKDRSNDWPTFQHDVQRTGFTNSVGDISSPSIKWKFFDSGDSANSAISDIDNDNDVEVVYGSHNGVYCVDGATGILEWENQINVDEFHCYTPTLYDVDNDGDEEVFVASSKLYCLSGLDGSEIWSKDFDGEVMCSPIVGDVDNDGANEVVICASYGSQDIYCLNALNGAEKWSKTLGYMGSWMSFSALDVDNDGYWEIFINDGETFYCLNGNDGSEQWIFPGNIDTKYSTPVLGDVDGDGYVELIIYNRGSGPYTGLLCFNATTGDADDGWIAFPYYGISWVRYAIGDVDNDQEMEIIVTCVNDVPLAEKVYCLNGSNGNEEWNFSCGSDGWSYPIICDIDGDSTIEIIIGNSNGKIYCISGTDGSLEWSFLVSQTYVHNSLSIADVDNDGYANILVSNCCLQYDFGLQPPVAILNCPYNGYTGEVISFYGGHSYDPDGTIVGYRWDYENDGEWDTEWQSNPVSTHVYNENFDGYIKMEVKDDEDLISTITCEIHITSTPDIIWEKTLLNMTLYSFEITNDGKYIFSGNFYSASDHGILLLKTDIEGNEEWRSEFPRDTSVGHEGRSVKQTSDNGYVVVGYSSAVNNPSQQCIRLIKTDVNGNTQWDKTLDHSYGSYCYSVFQTNDGGYVLGCDNSQIELIKTDSSGNVQWAKTYGEGWVWSVIQISNSDFILSGTIEVDSINYFGIIRTDLNGNEKYRKTYAIAKYGFIGATDINPTSDGGYILTGGTNTASILLKTDTSLNEIWRQNYSNTDGSYSVETTIDGGYIIGSTIANNPFCFIKTDSLGNEEWIKIIHGTHTGYYNGIAHQISENGYIGLMSDAHLVKVGWAPPTSDPGGPYYSNPEYPIHFDGADSHDNDEGGIRITQYDWKFYDGDSWHNNISAYPSHNYEVEGEYTVSLRVWDDEGDNNTANDTVYINNLPHPPTADLRAGEPYIGMEDDDPIEFNASWSHDNDENGSSIDRYDWKFYENDIWYNDIGPTQTHIYDDPGEYTVSVRVHDDEGITDNDETSVEILAYQPPVANTNGPYTGMEDSEILFDATGSFDPDEYHINEGGYEIVEYRWDFNNDDIWDTSWQDFTTPTYLYTYDYEIFGLAKLEVKDDEGNTSTATVSVSIEGYKDPSAVLDGSYHGIKDVSLPFDGSGSHDNDQNGDSITQYQWKYYDGDGWHNDGSTPTHVYSSTGTYIVTLKVTDNDGDHVGYDETTATVHIEEYQNPTAVAGGPYNGAAYSPISFDASGSYDNDENGCCITGYRWDWTNDGSWDTEWLSSPQTTHTYYEGFTGNVGLQVRDNDPSGHTGYAVDSASITVTAQPPTAGFTIHQTNNPSVFSFDASSSVDHRPGFDHHDLTYKWDFNNDGTWDKTGDWGSAGQPTWSYSSSGQKTIVLEVSNVDGSDTISNSVYAFNYNDIEIASSNKNNYFLAYTLAVAAPIYNKYSFSVPEDIFTGVTFQLGNGPVINGAISSGSGTDTWDADLVMSNGYNGDKVTVKGFYNGQMTWSTTANPTIDRIPGWLELFLFNCDTAITQGVGFTSWEMKVTLGEQLGIDFPSENVPLDLIGGKYKFNAKIEYLSDTFTFDDSGTFSIPLVSATIPLGKQIKLGTYPNFKVKGGFSFSAAATLESEIYGETRLVGTVGLSGKVTVSFDFPFAGIPFVGVVGVTGGVSAGAGVSFTVAEVASNGVSFAPDGTVVMYLSVGGNAGMYLEVLCGLARFEGGVEAEGTIYSRLPDLAHRLKLYGGAYAEASALWGLWSKKWSYGLEWDSGWSTDRSRNTGYMPSIDVLSVRSVEAVNMDIPCLKSYDRDISRFTRGELILSDNVGGSSDPKIVLTEHGEGIAVWSDINQSGDGFQSDICWSIYDGSNWGVIENTNTSGRCEFDPEVIVVDDGGSESIVLTYLVVDGIINMSTEMDAFYAEPRIHTAVWNMDDGWSFEGENLLVFGGTVNTMSLSSDSGGNVFLSYLKDTDSDPWESGLGSIYLVNGSIVDDVTGDFVDWSEPVLVENFDTMDLDYQPETGFINENIGGVVYTCWNHTVGLNETVIIPTVSGVQGFTDEIIINQSTLGISYTCITVEENNISVFWVENHSRICQTIVGTDPNVNNWVIGETEIVYENMSIASLKPVSFDNQQYLLFQRGNGFTPFILEMLSNDNWGNIRQISLDERFSLAQIDGDSNGICSQLVYLRDTSLGDWLVGRWRYNGGENTTAFDDSGLGNNGTLIGDTVWVGQANNSLDSIYGSSTWFNDTSSYVEVPYDPSLAVSDEFTYSCWVNLSDSSGYADILGVDGSWKMYQEDGGLGIKLWRTNGQIVQSDIATLFLDTWTFIGVTYYQGVLRIVVRPNGYDNTSALLDLGEYSIVDSAQSLKMGGFVGGMDDVWLFNRDISMSEVDSIWFTPYPTLGSIHDIVVQKLPSFAEITFMVRGKRSVNITTEDAVDFTGSPSGFSFTWDFGDGTTTSGASVSHQYDTAGFYTIICNATDPSTGVVTPLIEEISVSDTTSPVFSGLTSAIAGDTNVTLTWSNAVDTSPFITYYGYMRNDTGSFNYSAPIFTTSNTSYVVEYLEPDMNYHFVVRSYDAAGNCDNNTVSLSATPTDESPPVFDGLWHLYEIENEPDCVLLDWNASTDPSEPIIYHTYMATISGGQDFNSPVNSTNRTYAMICGLDLETTPYFFVVRAEDAFGNEDTNLVELNTLPGNSLPVADFSFTPSSPKKFDDINFIDNSSDSDGVIANWTWDFDDGNISYEQNPTHNYTCIDDYLVCLTVTDDEGGIDICCQLITVLNVGPSVDFYWIPPNPTTEDVVQFFDNSTDRSVANWSWDFDDGNISYDQNPTHQYPDAGNYTVCLTVTDDDGAVNSTCKTVVVSPGEISVNISLTVGWNMITIPVNNTWMASTLAENITGCQMVSWFDAEFQILRTHIVGVPAYDFPIQDGFGYFILVDQNSTFSVSGLPLHNVSVQLYEGWNMIGWYNQYNTTASTLAENITNCSMVSWFDAEFQILRTHIVGVPGYDFDIDCGMGLFILVDEASIWNGEG